MKKLRLAKPYYCFQGHIIFRTDNNMKILKIIWFDKRQSEQWKGLLWMSFAAIDNERKGSKMKKMSRFK